MFEKLPDMISEAMESLQKSGSGDYQRMKDENRLAARQLCETLTRRTDELRAKIKALEPTLADLAGLPFDELEARAAKRLALIDVENRVYAQAINTKWLVAELELKAAAAGG